MTKNQSTNKKFDLEDRTLKFSKEILRICKLLPKNPINKTISAQLVRSATSIGANYREANDALGKKDFLLRLRISRKEAKETVYWLELLIESDDKYKKNLIKLLKEAEELRNILSAIIKNSV